MGGEYVGGDPEQPRPGRALQWIEAAERAGGAHERLRGQVGHDLGLGAAPREVRRHHVDIAAVDLLELGERRA